MGTNIIDWHWIFNSHWNVTLEISLQVVYTFHKEIPLNLSEEITHGTSKNGSVVKNYF